MTGRIILSPRVLGDMDEIWSHTVKHWGSDQAEYHVRQIGQHIEAVATQPMIGRACSELRAGLLSISIWFPCSVLPPD
jgi:toxin ParE1/3/4